MKVPPARPCPVLPCDCVAPGLLRMLNEGTPLPCPALPCDCRPRAAENAARWAEYERGVALHRARTMTSEQQATMQQQVRVWGVRGGGGGEGARGDPDVPRFCGYHSLSTPTLQTACHTVHTTTHTIEHTHTHHTHHTLTHSPPPHTHTRTLTHSSHPRTRTHTHTHAHTRTHAHTQPSPPPPTT